MQQFNLDTIELLPNQVKEVLKCILHTILFTRAFGLVQPREEVIDFLDFYYATCNDDNLQKAIEERVDAFYDSWQRKKFEPSRRVVVISFDEKRYRSQLFGLSRAEERVRWEQWIVNLHVNTNAATTAINVNQATIGSDKEEEKYQRLSNELRSVIIQILRIANENKNHVPLLTSKDLFPFPYEIAFPIPEQGQSSQGLLAALGSMLKSPASAPTLT